MKIRTRSIVIGLLIGAFVGIGGLAATVPYWSPTLYAEAVYLLARQGITASPVVDDVEIFMPKEWFPMRVIGAKRPTVQFSRLDLRKATPKNEIDMIFITKLKVLPESSLLAIPGLVAYKRKYVWGDAFFVQRKIFDDRSVDIEGVSVVALVPALGISIHSTRVENFDEIQNIKKSKGPESK